MRRRLLPWILFGVILAVLAVLTVAHRTPEEGGDLWMLPFIGYGAVGAFVASHRPENRIGWVFIAIGLLGLVAGLGDVAVALRAIAEWRLAGTVLEGLTAVGWIGALGTILTLSLLLFPDGRLPSRRWGVVAWAALAGTALLTLLEVIMTVGGGPIASALEIAGLAGGVLFVGAVVASAASIVVRFRRSRGDEREQLKWFVAAAALTAATFVATIAVEEGGGEGTLASQALGVLFPLAMTTIPVSAGIAILRYRLYDIDLVISRALVYGALAAFITAVYVGIVVGIGRAVGAGDEPNVGLSIAATALVAVLFHPVRARVQRFANRLVYGKRSSPYEILARFSEKVAGTYAAEDVLERMARVVAEGTGARQTGVWLRVADELRPAAAWPAGSHLGSPVPVRGESDPSVPSADRTFPAEQEGQLVGALTVSKSLGDPIRPEEEKLTEDLSAQAGLVLSNLRLTAELRRRLEEISGQARELQASRRRLVAAQDRERRRLERDIHDGAQQHLVALAVNLKLARTVSARDPEKARVLLRQLRERTSESLEVLRDLARGVYPASLQSGGLAVAIREAAERSSMTIEVDADAVRYPLEVEAAVYFSVLEALQNAMKYADASRIRVQLHQNDGALTFKVVDDGRGFDRDRAPKGAGLQNMADRLATVGGEVEVRSASGAGTTVVGWVPAGAGRRTA